MKNALSRADEFLRSAFLNTANIAAQAVLMILTFFCFAVLCLKKNLQLLAGTGSAVHAFSVILLCLPFLLALWFVLNAVRRQKRGFMEMILCTGICTAAMLARITFLDHVSSDYSIYLSDWMQKLSEGSFSSCMKADIGEYNVLYQYILFLITRLPVPPLYGVKIFSFFGDALLCGAAAKLAGEKKCGCPATCLILLLPTCILNGGMFAQCDSLFTACALWGLACALNQKPTASAIWFALSLSFKLQAVFLLPVIAVLWADRKLRVQDALTFIATLIAVMLPALLGGKTLMQIIRIYTSQTGLYTGLNYGAANLFGLIETSGLDVYAYGTFGIALAMGACLLLLHAGLRKTGSLDQTGYILLQLLMILCMVWLLPRMHERYFYPADILCAVLALRTKEGILPAALIELASFSVYWQTVVALPAASLCMLAAILLLLIFFQKEYKTVRS